MEVPASTQKGVLSVNVQLDTSSAMMHLSVKVEYTAYTLYVHTQSANN